LSMRYQRYLCLVVAFCFSTMAQAAARKATSPFERRLKSAGWTLTSKSISAKPGDIYNRATKTVWAPRKKCFTASMNQREIASSLQMKKTNAEISGFFSGIRAKAKGSGFEAKAYLDPYRYWIPSTELQILPACLERIRQSPDRGDLVVVTDIVSAQYQTVTRKTREALVKALVAGARAKKDDRSATFSKKPVTIAYKRRSVVAFIPVNLRTQGTVKLKTKSLSGKKCAGRVWVDREHVGFTQKKASLPVPVKAYKNHLVQGSCGKSKSDLISVSVNPGQNLEVMLKMQRYSKKQLMASQASYRRSKGWDTFGYIAATGLLSTSGVYYFKSSKHYSEADNINTVDQGDRYADLRSQGDTARETALLYGGGGAVVLTSTLTHALFSTAIKKGKYKKQKKSRNK